MGHVWGGQRLFSWKGAGNGSDMIIELIFYKYNLSLLTVFACRLLKWD